MVYPYHNAVADITMMLFPANGWVNRGAAARVPTAAAQEVFAMKATRGQPMHRPRLPIDTMASTPSVGNGPGVVSADRMYLACSAR